MLWWWKGSMSNSTYFTEPPINPACELPVVCTKVARYPVAVNGSINGVININTDVTSSFGHRNIVICRTTRNTTYQNVWKTPAGGCSRGYSSSTDFSDSLTHESSEILYVNNQHNVVLYKKFNCSLSCSGSSTNYIGTNTTGGYPMIGKVCIDPVAQVSEQIILSKPTEDIVLHNYSTTLSGSHYLILISVPDPLPELVAKAIDSDPDVRNHGTYYSGNFIYPPWIEAVMGTGTGRDAIWYKEYIDQYTG